MSITATITNVARNGNEFIIYCDIAGNIESFAFTADVTKSDVVAAIQARVDFLNSIIAKLDLLSSKVIGQVIS